MTHHPSLCVLRSHGARLLFPPAATLLFWCSPSTSPAAPERRYLCTVHLSPPRSLPAGVGGWRLLVWMAVDWLTRFAPLATLLSALLVLSARYGGLLHPAAPG